MFACLKRAAENQVIGSQLEREYVIMVTILFFGELGGLTQTKSMTLALPRQDTSVDGLLDLLSQSLPAAAIKLLRDKTAMVAVNQQIATWQTILKGGDEVAFMPPVSGG